jgi:hypothetical protein
MNEHKINLTKLQPYGQTVSEIKDDIFYLSSAKEQPFNVCGDMRHYYAEVPGCYHLPLKIDITARIDAPALYVVFGAGSITFGNRAGRIDDICGPHSGKKIFFSSYLSMNEFFRITIIYDFKEMQILVNGEERYYSTNEKYMKTKVFAAMNNDGFPLKISCDNRVAVQIQRITVTEYDKSAEIIHDVSAKAEPIKFFTLIDKPTFESCIAELPDALRSAVVDIDAWIRTLRPMKFKRQIDKNGEKITYVASEQGFSYQVYISGGVLRHTAWWYILTQGNPETWHRKADNMENTLNYLSETDPDFACKMFNNLYKCAGSYGSGCLGKTPYTYGNHKIISCHGKLNFTMNLSEFDDVKHFINAVNDITIGDCETRKYL